jgi:hypothetical protein
LVLMVSAVKAGIHAVSCRSEVPVGQERPLLGTFHPCLALDSDCRTDVPMTHLPKRCRSLVSFLVSRQCVKAEGASALDFLVEVLREVQPRVIAYDTLCRDVVEYSCSHRSDDRLSQGQPIWESKGPVQSRTRSDPAAPAREVPTDL